VRRDPQTAARFQECVKQGFIIENQIACFRVGEEGESESGHRGPSEEHRDDKIDVLRGNCTRQFGRITFIHSPTEIRRHKRRSPKGIMKHSVAKLLTPCSCFRLWAPSFCNLGLRGMGMYGRRTGIIPTRSKAMRRSGAWCYLARGLSRD